MRIFHNYKLYLLNQKNFRVQTSATTTKEYLYHFAVLSLLTIHRKTAFLTMLNKIFTIILRAQFPGENHRFRNNSWQTKSHLWVNSSHLVELFLWQCTDTAIVIENTEKARTSIFYHGRKTTQTVFLLKLAWPIGQFVQNWLLE